MRQRAPRTAIALALLPALLVGCTWGRSRPENCASFISGKANERAERLAATQGLASIGIEHAMCSNKEEPVKAIGPAGRAEVGWCTRIRDEVPAKAVAVAASVGQRCRAAVAAHVRYAHWVSFIGDTMLFAGELDVIESPRGPPKGP
jgi:hypothetical protein